MTAPHTFASGVPVSVGDHAELSSIAAWLDEPDTRSLLRRGQAEGRYPEQALAELHARGLARLFGPDATAWHLNALLAALARVDGSLAITVGVNALALLPIHLAATPRLRARVLQEVEAGAMAAMLLTEWSHGSDLLANATTARPHGDGFVIDGRKALINGGRRHDLLTVLARTRPPSPGAAAYGDHTLFWIPRGPGIEALGRHPTLPTRGADISEVELRGVEVGRDQVIGAVGDGFSVVRRTLCLSRAGIAALAAGATAGMLAQALHHARTRELYGAPILELDAIADHVAELAELEAQCAAVSLRATAFANAFGTAAAPMTAVAKLVVPRLAERAADLGRRVLGSRALLEDHDFARFVRDVTLYGIFDGTQHVMLEELSFVLERIVRGRRLDDGDPLARSRQAWTTGPRRLSELDAPRRSLRVLDPRRVADALAHGRFEWSSALPALAHQLVRTYERLGGQRTTSLQSIRFACAEASAWLDVGFACAELGDPQLCAEVGRPHPVRTLALDASGSRRVLAVCTRLRHLSALGPADEPDPLADVQRRLTRIAFEARRRLVAEIRRPDSRFGT
jgi:alkylation response protein AidB-like acyl-CoA dehydrogenase